MSSLQRFVSTCLPPNRSIKWIARVALIGGLIATMLSKHAPGWASIKSIKQIGC
jgi:hypothetical protein